LKKVRKCGGKGGLNLKETGRVKRGLRKKFRGKLELVTCDGRGNDPATESLAYKGQEGGTCAGKGNSKGRGIKGEGLEAGGSQGAQRRKVRRGGRRRVLGNRKERGL